MFSITRDKGIVLGHPLCPALLLGVAEALLEQVQQRVVRRHEWRRMRASLASIAIGAMLRDALTRSA